MADKKTARKRGGTKNPDINKKLVWKYIKERNSTDPGRLAIITHTSGTTRGTRKPLPYTDRAVNSVLTKWFRIREKPTRRKR